MKCNGSEAQSLAAFLTRNTLRSNRPAVRRNRGAANGLQRPEKNQLSRRLGNTAERRTDYKDEQAETIKFTPAEQVAQPSHGDDEANESEIVNQDRPLNRCQVSVKRFRQGGKRNQERSLVHADNGLPDANI